MNTTSTTYNRYERDEIVRLLRRIAKIPSRVTGDEDCEDMDDALKPLLDCLATIMRADEWPTWRHDYIFERIVDVASGDKLTIAELMTLINAPKQELGPFSN